MLFFNLNFKLHFPRLNMSELKLWGASDEKEVNTIEAPEYRSEYYVSEKPKPQYPVQPTGFALAEIWKYLGSNPLVSRKDDHTYGPVVVRNRIYDSL